MPSSRSLWPVGMESINQDLKMVFIWTINLFYCTVFTGITTALNQLSSFNKGASLQIWAYSIWTEDTAAVTPLIRGSPLSRETPQGSSLTNKAKTFCELHILVTLLPESPKVTAKTASKPPAPGTPANKIPSMFIVASKSWVCDSGSICNFGKLVRCWTYGPARWKRTRPRIGTHWGN